MKVLSALVLVFLLASCSRPSAEETFASAEQAQQMAESELGVSPRVQDSLFMSAIRHYETVAEDHPDDPLAETSLFRVAELHNNGTRRFQDAIDAYRRFLVRYPDSPQAPVSLFMIGFLYNNELGRIEDAGTTYREFLERYPNHELAPSARGELEHLGKSPEEIIATQTALQKSAAQSSESGPSGP